MAFLLSMPFFATMVSAAWADNYALLIGVSNYRNARIRPLKGPANDVTLMWRLLTRERRFSPANVTVLADGLPSGPNFPKSAGDPTKHAINKAFEMLAQRATRNDGVLIFFSGHGTQQPVGQEQYEPESGNLDQVMLPIDAGTYDPSTRIIRNGLVDDEIGMALAKIRSKGAHVWVIVDACHAGTMTRDRVDGVEVRGIDPRELGVPARMAVQSAQGELGTPKTWRIETKQRVDGTLVGFFAVDSSREAIERPFEEFAPPMVGEGVNRRMGVFTFFLHKVLSYGRRYPQSYRQLAHLIVQDMQQSSAVAPPAMPVFDGDLNRSVLFAGERPPVWAAKIAGDNVEIAAGSLHGLAEGAKIKLARTPDGPEWATASVTQADLVRTTARVDERQSAGLVTTAWASVAVPSVSFRLAVAEPPVWTSQSKSDEERRPRKIIDQAKAKLKAENSGAIDWVASEAPAAVRLRNYGGRLWLLPSDGEWVREDMRATNPRLRNYPLTPSISLDANDAADQVADLLYRIVRATNIVRVAALASSGLERGNPTTANIQLTAEQIAVRGAHPHRPCPELRNITESESQERTLLEPGTVVNAFHCDLIRMTIKNVGQRDLDVNVTYVDALSGMTPIGQCTRRLPPGQTIKPSVWIRTWNDRMNAPDSVGLEHIIVTAVEQKDGIQTDLCFIQEPRRSTRADQLAKDRRSLVRLLKEASLAPTGLRGSIPVEDPSEISSSAAASIFLFSFNVTPLP